FFDFCYLLQGRQIKDFLYMAWDKLGIIAESYFFEQFSAVVAGPGNKDLIRGVSCACHFLV
ncbi:MAG: hypothetical protein IIU33_06850, partial [Bacteroidales bacterium]|nr:hypothetical protein [Bacteroidales bacterium]